MKNFTCLLLLIISLFLSNNLFSQRPMEYLDRSLVPLETNEGVYLTWRMMGTDPADISFNLYRDGVKINDQPINETTNYIDSEGTVSSLYQVETIWDDKDNEMSEKTEVWALYPPVDSPGNPYVPLKRIELPAPPVIEGVEFTPGDMSVGDLTGDGRYELIFEWEASNGKNSFLEAIDLDGNSLWRINTGPNVTTTKLNIMVYDLNMDGRAEVAILTGPGTIDGKGNYINKGPAKKYDPEMVIPRHNGETGNLLDDPQFITLFDGLTGEELATADYWPAIGPRSTMSEVWGDGYGHRASSLKGAVLYNKRYGPLLVYGRGVYGRVAYGAYRWNGKDRLQNVWRFDSHDEGYEGYSGQGNHSVAVGDLDGDGNDELIYGAAAIDHDGTGLYTTGFGHGDSHALSDLDPFTPGLEYFQTHEGGDVGISMRSAGTGEVIWQIDAPGDIGRGWAADVDPRYASVSVGIGLGNFNNKGVKLGVDYNAYDQPLYFTGAVQKALRGGGNISGGYHGGRILTSWHYGATTIHSTKTDANLVADILGDWREEVIFPSRDKTALLIFSSWLPTERKNPTLMHDPVYRMNVAVQNVGYNQPAHVGYYFRDGYPEHDIELIKYEGSTSIESNKVEIEDVSIYPNPVIDNVRIIVKDDNFKFAQLSIYDISGIQVYDGNVQNGIAEVDLKLFKSGLYLLSISNSKGVISDKFIKK